jgi:hypothetical protein
MTSTWVYTHTVSPWAICCPWSDHKVLSSSNTGWSGLSEKWTAVLMRSARMNQVLPSLTPWAAERRVVWKRTKWIVPFPQWSATSSTSFHFHPLQASHFKTDDDIPQWSKFGVSQFFNWKIGIGSFPFRFHNWQSHFLCKGDTTFLGSIHVS